MRKATLKLVANLNQFKATATFIKEALTKSSVPSSEESQINDYFDNTRNGIDCSHWEFSPIALQFIDHVYRNWA